MDEDPLQIVSVFLEYLYTYNYRDPNFKSDEERDETLIFHAHVYAFAEQYDTPGLQQLAATKFCNALTPARKVDCFTISLDIMREIYTTTPPRARHLRDIVMTAFQNDQARRTLLQSKAFIKIANDAPEVWRDFLQGALGLVETRWGIPWVLRDEERDRMIEVLSDIPPRWIPLVRYPLLADRGSTNGVLELSKTRSYLREKVDKTPNRYKRIVRALFGLQCDPKTYRCEGCDETFDWALPAKACRTGPWPCRRGCGVTHTIDEWEDRVEGGGDEDENEDEDESEDEIGSWANPNSTQRGSHRLWENQVQLRRSSRISSQSSSGSQFAASPSERRAQKRARRK
ncbi:putative btb poz-like protein [Neofusicoccum parvum]|nr:putative btb poz-like protein [Neofusicoccum parvum]